MSNKLTRSVIYLSESDRPKKVEPLSFTEWCVLNGYINMPNEILNIRVNEYSTYLQEFSAEEEPVQLLRFAGNERTIDSCIDAKYFTEITFLGATEFGLGAFSCSHSEGVRIYYGKLNSGKY